MYNKFLQHENEVNHDVKNYKVNFSSRFFYAKIKAFMLKNLSRKLRIGVISESKIRFDQIINTLYFVSELRNSESLVFAYLSPESTI